MKTFTQDQVNAIVAKETAPLKRMVADLERVKAELTAAAQTLAAERDSARSDLQASQQKHAAAAERVRQSAVSTQIMTALMAARVIPEALQGAAHDFARSVEFELDEEHAITGASYGGTPHATAQEAARAFLKDRPWYEMPVNAGGASTRAPTGSKRRPEPDPLEGNTAEAMARAWSRR